jgi:hypothetical protein
MTMSRIVGEIGWKKVGEDVCVVLFGVNSQAVGGAWSPVCRW